MRSAYKLCHMTVEPKGTRGREGGGERGTSYTVVDRSSTPASMPVGSGEIVVRHVDVYLPSVGGATPRTAARSGRVGTKAATTATDAVPGVLVVGNPDALDELADHLTPDTIPTSAVVLQARRNAEWRAHVAETYGLLTAAEVADVVGSTADNRGAVASRLAKAGLIFGVKYKGGRIVYPGFQFTAAGDVVDTIAPILSALTDAGLEGWELVSWFTAANPLLGGDAPANHTDVAAVLDAARAEAAPVGF